MDTFVEIETALDNCARYIRNKEWAAVEISISKVSKYTSSMTEEQFLYYSLINELLDHGEIWK